MLPTEKFPEQYVPRFPSCYMWRDRQSVHEIHMKVELQDEGCTKQDSELNEIHLKLIP